MAAATDVEDPEIDKGAQAVELIGYVARECATFFKRLADGVRKYELTGDLPVRRGPAPKNGQKNGTEVSQKLKAKSRSRKGEDGEKVKAVHTTLVGSLATKSTCESRSNKASYEDCTTSFRNHSCSRSRHSSPGQGKRTPLFSAV